MLQKSGREQIPDVPIRKLSVPPPHRALVGADEQPVLAVMNEQPVLAVMKCEPETFSSLSSSLQGVALRSAYL